MPFFAYILKSQKTGRYYYGSAENLESRLDAHNSGKVQATKGYRPYVLHYSEEFETRSEAFRREKFFKTIDVYNWLKQNKIT